MSGPLRVLHVVGLMSPAGGGAETWLMDVYRRIDRSRVQFDFLVHTPERLPFHAEVEALGGRLLRACRPVRLWEYGRAFRQLVARHGPYPVCHVHVPYCGYALRLARTAGIPVRVAHGHSGSFSIGFSPPARAFLWWTNRWVAREATAGFACSRRAAGALFGRGWERDPRWRVLYCGIDLGRFAGPVDGGRLRRELGIPDDAFVVGHVGRFQPEKNHAFLIRVAAEVFSREQRARLLLVGDGELRPRVAALARSLGILDRVIFAGQRCDVPDLMRGVMDVLLLPSLFEGFGLVGLESQAAGLPLVMSDAITDEVVVSRESVRAVSLAAGPAVWAGHVLARGARRTTGAARPDDERFSIDLAARRLTDSYLAACGRS